MEKIKINTRAISYPVRILKSIIAKSDNRLAVLANSNELILKIQGNPAYGEFHLPMVNNETFEFIVNHSFFNEILSKVSSEEIEVVLGNKVVSILDGDTKFEIPVVDGKVFTPDTGDVTKTSKVSKVFTPEVWAKMQNYLLFATAKDDNRPIFRGIGVKTEGNSLMMYATDTHIMSKFVVSTSVNDLPSLVILPREIFSVKTECDVTFSIEGSFAKVAYDGFTFIIPMLLGNPPDYERVIPKAYNMELVLDKNMLLKEIRKLLICSTAKEVIPIQVYFRQGKVDLFTENQELGKIKGSFPANVPVEFVGKKIAFNGQYLADLSHFEADEIKLATVANGDLGISLSPVLFSSKTEQFQLVMTPIRVNTWNLDE